MGKCITMSLLENISRKATNLYIDKGYITTRAFVKPSDVRNGVVEMFIAEGKLEKIVFTEDVEEISKL